jgi:hypothetical protein
MDLIKFTEKLSSKLRDRHRKLKETHSSKIHPKLVATKIINVIDQSMQIIYPLKINFAVQKVIQ